MAPELLGQIFHHGSVALRITEVEAYGGPEDSASHCRFGRTARNAPMWEAGGVAYLYLCYGLHWMLNVVTGSVDQGAAVLIRAAEPLSGLDQIQARRGGLQGPALLNGPGKVGQALGVDGNCSGHPLFRKGGLELRRGERPEPILQGPRVGIDFATKADRERPWRFALGGSAWVSRPRDPERLRPATP